MDTPPNQTTSPSQEKIAKTVSTIVLTGTCIFGVLALVWQLCLW